MTYASRNDDGPLEIELVNLHLTNVRRYLLQEYINRHAVLNVERGNITRKHYLNDVEEFNACSETYVDVS